MILLSEGAAADPTARDRLAGVVNAMHIDSVLARGGHGQDFGRLARKYIADEGDLTAPDDRIVAPWVALPYDGSPVAAEQAARILDEVELATLAPLGRPAGPGYQHYWIDKVKPGLTRLWPLPWPGRFRPRRVADDPGLLAVDDLAGCSCGLDRHLDLSQPAAPVPTATDRPVR